MPEAARITDSISHTSALLGLVVGALAGALIGAAIVLSGGAALGAIALAACTGLSLGGVVGQFLGSFLTLNAGVLSSAGALTVHIGHLPAARAVIDAAICSTHSGPPILIAQGSSSVLIEFYPVARAGDLGTCSFKISSGCKDVLIGGDSPGTFLEVSPEVPGWLQGMLFVLGFIGPAGLMRLGGMAWLNIGFRLGLSFAGGVGGGYLGHILGRNIFGEDSAGQKILAFGLGVVGSLIGFRLSLPKSPPSPASVQGSSPISIPSSAKIQVQQKTGYSQIRYKWTDGGYKYEVRWHSRTPNAPKGQGDTWRVTRVTPGNSSNTPKMKHELAGDVWVPSAEWHQAIQASKAGTATAAQNAMLEAGHFPAGGY